MIRIFGLNSINAETGGTAKLCFHSGSSVLIIAMTGGVSLAVGRTNIDRRPFWTNRTDENSTADRVRHRRRLESGSDHETRQVGGWTGGARSVGCEKWLRPAAVTTICMLHAILYCPFRSRGEAASMPRWRRRVWPNAGYLQTSPFILEHWTVIIDEHLAPSI